MVGEVVTPRYRQASILGVEASDPTEGEGACEVKHQTDQGKGDLYNPYTGSRDPGREVIIDGILQQVDEGTEKA